VKQTGRANQVSVPFYETYKDKPKLSPLVREITWTNNMVIVGQAKPDEAKEFYLKLCKKYNYSKRELERQIDSMLFERTILSNKRNKALIEKNKSLDILRDNYTLEFLNLPEEHKEGDLQKSIIANLKKFILEFGRDFSLVGEEYRVQVGNQDSGFRIFISICFSTTVNYPASLR
jgi:predicted nuclease of restriction endonuclease-like (RecB) superfamily